MTTHKIALLSANWTRWEHRLLSGALRFADAHPGVFVRPFAPYHDIETAWQEIQNWGAVGAFGILEDVDLQKLVAAGGGCFPIVNCALAGDYPGVVTVQGDFTAFLDLAVTHLRQLGLRSIGMLMVEEGQHIRERLVEPFIRITQPSRPDDATCVLHVDRGTVWNPDANVEPIPEKLVNWLQRLPKPSGVVCPPLGGGGYLIRCCHALNLRVPEDVAVIGSDETDLSLACEPTLTSVVLSMDLVGFDALRILNEMIHGYPPKSTIVRLKSAELTVRESTGRRRPEICDIAAALECIQTNATKGITVDQVIRQTQKVSRVTFHRRFREATGKSPAEAIRDRQLSEVRRLLAGTELPVTMISDLAGFSSAKVLARSFRQVERMSPRDYRKQKQLPEPQAH